MPPKNGKRVSASTPPGADKTPMGASPAALAKRNKAPNNWCAQPDIEFDAMCDINNPKNILYKDIVKAAERIKDDIPMTPLMYSARSLNPVWSTPSIEPLGTSFHERGAINALLLLTPEQKQAGIITASLGNFAMALSFYGQRHNVKVTVVFPDSVMMTIVQKCKECKATVVLNAGNFTEAKNQAFVIATQKGFTYINGYDHPDVIAGSGTIGLEILEQLPETDVIIVPIGGGGLIAGIAEAAKHIKPEIRVYGVEPDKCCCFFKAMENNAPYTTVVGQSVASMLGVTTAGYNAYYTARPLVDKMILLDDDWIARSIHHFVEEEKIIVEGAGAAALGPILTRPSVLPELKEKTVVCVVTGGNIDNLILTRCIERAKAIEGRLIKLTVTLPADNSFTEQLKILSMIANMNCNVLQTYRENAWITESDLHTVYEDFDEFCDPENPKTILLEDVLKVQNLITPHVIYTPCVPSHYQKEFVMPLYYKLENMQMSGSFKERGCVSALLGLPLDKRKLGVVMGSLGNDALAMAYHAGKLGVPVFIVLPASVPTTALQKCINLGAKVYVLGQTLMEAQKHARSIARDKGLTYINGRDHPEVLSGYGTMALEILEQVPLVDAVLVPVGSGGLAAAISKIIKHKKPECLVYGVQPESMPSLFNSLINNEPATVALEQTMAHSVTVPNVGVNAFHNAKDILDKMLLVNEDWIARSILHMMEKERLVVEGAGALPLAAIIGNLVPELKLKHVVCIVSGGNIDSILLSRCLERGRSAEGCLVKFSVGIQDTGLARTQLLRLLENRSYNVERLFEEHRWVESDTYRLQLRLVCAAINLEHALELKRVVERAYPTTTVFETAPFNDKRTCPCYISTQQHQQQY